MDTTQPEYIAIGTVMSPWGYHGQIKVDVATDFPERFEPSSRVYIDRNPVTIKDVVWNKGRAVIKIEGLDNEEDAAKLKGRLVEIHHSQLFELPEGEYFHFELVGLTVKTIDGETIGEITDILSISSADVYVIKGNNEEVLIPATDEVVKSVDLENGIMIIEPVDGLLTLNQKKEKQK